MINGTAYTFLSWEYPDSLSHPTAPLPDTTTMERGSSFFYCNNAVVWTAPPPPAAAAGGGGGGRMCAERTEGDKWMAMGDAWTTSGGNDTEEEEVACSVLAASTRSMCPTQCPTDVIIQVRTHWECADDDAYFFQQWCHRTDCANITWHYNANFIYNIHTIFRCTWPRCITQNDTAILWASNQVENTVRKWSIFYIILLDISYLLIVI